ncbi:MAG: hypothetical protein ACTIDY_02330 [Halomonadaceae bacterium]|uniref:Uncharacterized protein n=1 Tax=Halomonas colorata TaxID=2742615 RepID=A0ABR9G013_9GAMM|nr:hypothetical protein [Halomonas colorata]MBE0464227.1 hypothetical protein [Halomonas colorata]
MKSKDDKKTSAEVFSKNEDIKFKLDIKISERGWEICVKTFLQPSCDSEANIMVWVDGRALTVKVDDAGNWVATGKISSALDRLHNKALLVIKTGSHSKSIAHWDYISLPARELVEGLADEK